MALAGCEQTNNISEVQRVPASATVRFKGPNMSNLLSLPAEAELCKSMVCTKEKLYSSTKLHALMHIYYTQ